MNKEIELKGFTKEQIKEINDKAIGYKVTRLRHYPDNEKFLEAKLELNIGMVVVWNVDSFILKYDKDRNAITTSKNKWVVLASDSKMFKYNEEFEELEDAVQYAYRMYDKHINAEYALKQHKVNEILDKRGYKWI